MAKNVDLRNRVVHNPAEPPKKPPKADPSGLKVPPAAGSKPVPKLTPLEQQALEQSGWKPGQPVPDELPAHVAAMAQQLHAQAGQPQMSKVETVDVLQEAPDAQLRILRSAQAKKAAPDVSSMLREPPAVDMASQAVPGWKPPNMPGYTPVVQNPEAELPTGKQTRPGPDPRDPLGLGIDLDTLGDNEEIVVQLPTEPGQQQKVEVRSKTDEPQTSPAQDPQPSMTSGSLADTECPHCGWTLSMPDIPEPAYHEKQAFLQAVLGQKPFIKQYELLGGALRVRFRTLATKEVDTIYRQVMLERQKGLVSTVEDYWEKINRYRLYLQTCHLSSEHFQHDLPDGYDRETNPNAEGVWQFDPVEDDPRETGLPQIEQHFLRSVFTTEVIHRTINNQCSRFNRLVAKLEAMMDNSDFWRQTGEQS